MMNGSALQRISEDIPRISNPLGLAAMGIATLGVGAALTRLRPSDREGRSQRFARMIEARLRATLEKQVARGEYGDVNSAPWDVDRCEVQVNEGFGKPTMVCFTVVMTAGTEELAEDLRAHAAQGLLAAAVEAAWRNPEIAPIVISFLCITGELPRMDTLHPRPNPRIWVIELLPDVIDAHAGRLIALWEHRLERANRLPDPIPLSDGTAALKVSHRFGVRR